MNHNRMAKLAHSLLTRGGWQLTVSFLGANRLVEHESLTGPCKAAFDSGVRYLAADAIRVNAI